MLQKDYNFSYLFLSEDQYSTRTLHFLKIFKHYSKQSEKLLRKMCEISTLFQIYYCYYQQLLCLHYLRDFLHCLALMERSGTCSITSWAPCPSRRSCSTCSVASCQRSISFRQETRCVCVSVISFTTIRPWSLISHLSQLDAAATESSYPLGDKQVNQPALSQTLVGHSVIVVRNVCSLVGNFISRHVRGLPPRRCH